MLCGLNIYINISYRFILLNMTLQIESVTLKPQGWKKVCIDHKSTMAEAHNNNQLLHIYQLVCIDVSP